MPNRMPTPLQRPEAYNSFKELCDELKSTVYAIVRVRAVDGGTNHATIGTGFLGGPNRLVTCAHVINDNKHENPENMNKHKPGDTYLFIQKDDLGRKHIVSRSFELGRDLKIYENIDIAVFHLGDWFYIEGDKYRQHPDNYLLFSLDSFPVGSDAGVLGYPFNNVSFRPDGTPRTDGVVVRADRGVVNTKSKLDNITTYEFTMGFNPGNSGGPVLDLVSGRVIGVVQGFQWYLMTSKPMDYNAGTDNFRALITVTTSYSRAIASSNLKRLGLLNNYYIK